MLGRCVMILVGTRSGLHQLGAQTALAGQGITAISRDGAWAVADGRTIWSRSGGSWEQVGELEALRATCIARAAEGLLVGTKEAHLFRLDGGTLRRVAGFDDVKGRDSWYTPWGDPPDTRSLAEDAGGTLYANVHVGGVIVSTDGAETWDPSGLDFETDVHEVLALEPGRVLAATGMAGLCESRDHGATWHSTTDGLHGAYARAVAVAGDTVLVSASTGPSTKMAALYRRPLSSGSFDKCRDGLPEWFGSNIDTRCVATDGSTVVLGTADGVVYKSDDEGRTWEEAARGLPHVTCIAFAA